MGWRPPPRDPAYGRDCRAFPAGKTPREIIAFFSGIEYCWDFFDDDMVLHPPAFVLTQNPVHNCEWNWVEGEWSCLLGLDSIFNCVITLAYQTHFTVFEGTEPPISFGFQNTNMACGLPFHYGHHGAVHVIPWAETDGPSLAKLCVLAGVPYNIDTKCDITPIDKDEGWVRFFRDDLLIKSRMKFALADIY